MFFFFSNLCSSSGDLHILPQEWLTKLFEAFVKNCHDHDRKARQEVLWSEVHADVKGEK